MMDLDEVKVGEQQPPLTGADVELRTCSLPVRDAQVVVLSIEGEALLTSSRAPRCSGHLAMVLLTGPWSSLKS